MITNAFLPANDASSHNATVTELILADRSPAQLELVLPMIAFMTQQQSERWVTWVTDQVIDKRRLLALGVNPQILRILPCSNKDDLLWITWEALSSGTSHAVIADAGRLSEMEILQLEQAAQRGTTQGLILRTR